MSTSDITTTTTTTTTPTPSPACSVLLHPAFDRPAVVNPRRPGRKPGTISLNAVRIERLVGALNARDSAGQHGGPSPAQLLGLGGANLGAKDIPASPLLDAPAWMSRVEAANFRVLVGAIELGHFSREGMAYVAGMLSARLSERG